MNNIILLLNITLPIAYLASTFLYGIAFFKSNLQAERVKSVFIFVIIVVHLFYLLFRTIVFSHPPITNVFEIFTLVAFSLVVSYMYIEYKTKVRTTGFFILLTATIFQILSSLFIKDLINVPEILRSNLLGIHVLSAILGFAAITISAIYGILYLMLYHEIKSNKFGVIYNKLPNLEILENMNFTATIFGFILLSVGIIVGLIWLPKAFENFSYADPKLIGTSFIWLIYAIGLTAKKFARWRGKKIIWLSIIGFVVALFSMTVVNMLFSDFHKFL